MKKILYTFILSGMLFLLRGQTFTLSLQPDTAGQDATLSKASPGLNQGSATTLRASRNTSSNYERSLIKFDLSSIDHSAIIVSAKLILYGTNHVGTGDNGGVLQVVPQLWHEFTAVWNNSTLLFSTSMPTVSLPAPTTSTQNYTLEVTNMVQTMVNSPVVNFGWMLHMAAENNSNTKSLEFGSSDNSNAAKRPQLLLTYYIPMAISPYMSPGATNSSTNGGTFLQVNNGVPAYTYSWSNGATTKDLNNIAPGTYTVRVTDSQTVTVNRVIPVLAENGTVSYTLNYNPASSFSDAMLLTQAFNANAENTNYGTSPDLQAYNKTTVDGNSIARGLVAFDLSMIPPYATVNGATLTLANQLAGFDTAITVHLCRVLQAWNQNTVTSGNQPLYNDSTGDPIEFNYDAKQSSYSFDVTTHLQKMVAAGATTNGWLLKLKSEVPSSITRAVSFAGDNSVSGTRPVLIMHITLPPLTGTETALNWHQEDTYDENGTLIGSEKNYLDNLGRGTEHLVKNASGDVFTSLTVYDSYGRPAISTLPAYTGTALVYQSGFFRDQYGQVFNYQDFDGPTTLNNTTPIQSGILNTLGYYYSNINAFDSYQAIADNPYSRTEYTGDPGGSPRRVSKPGNAFKMGSNKESYTFTMMSGNELNNVYGSGNSYKAVQSATAALTCTPLSTSANILATKQIMITPDNVESISYSSGGKSIANCLSSLSAAESCTYSVKNYMSYDGTQNTDIHLPDACKSSLSLPLPSQTFAVGSATYNFSTADANISYTFTDLFTDQLLVKNTDYTVNASSRAVTFGSAFLAKYTGRSLVLRIGFSYDPAFVTYIFAQGAPDMSDAEVDYTLNYGRFSKNYYDLGSNLLKSVSPKGFACSTPTTITMASNYQYDYKGHLVASHLPDQDTLRMMYDTEGKLRFTQNKVQLSGNRFSYTSYDKHGRPVETGEYLSNTSSAPVWFNQPTNSFIGLVMAATLVDQSDGLTAAGKSNSITTGYSAPSSTDDIPTGYTDYSSYRNFRAGQRCYVKNVNATTWFNYDKVDRPTASVTQITEPDFVLKNSSVNNQIKTAQVAYNYYNGLMTSATYQGTVSAEKLYYQYTYNTNLSPLTTSLTYGGTAHLLNTNSYNKMGRLNRVVIANNLQGIDYVYTLNGGLKAINHPGLDPSQDPGGDAADYTGTVTPSSPNKDLFGEIIDYYYKDYERNGNSIIGSIQSGSSKCNGLTYATRFKVRSTVNGVTNGYDNITGTTIINGTNYQLQELGFTYTYDQFNQLATSTFNTYNNATGLYTSRSEYAETGASAGNIAYDRNGNITRLVRQAYSGSVMDDLTYTISSTGNQLASIVDASPNTLSLTSAVNFKTPSTSAASNFTYNAIGQMTASPAEDIGSITYFPNGKIKKVTYTSTGNTVQYEYGPKGEKIKSKYYTASNGRNKYTWYVGPYIYEYDSAAATPGFTIAEVQVPGGVLRVNGTSVSSGYLVYQMTDHLGNVRASYKATGTGNGITMLSYSDYYAFGGQLPARNWSSENYRFGFQGQEKGSTGTPWYEFELRQYNADLGRWSAPDPYGQFASPYLAMANNPVSTTDPNGGFVDFPTGAPNEFLGKRELDNERDMATGAYSTDAIQKRYEDDLDNLKKNFLDHDFGNGRDIKGYLNAVSQLNSTYMGLTFMSKQHISMKNGSEYLTAGDININQQGVYSNNYDVHAYQVTNTAQGPAFAEDNDLQRLAQSNQEGTRRAAGTSVSTDNANMMLLADGAQGSGNGSGGSGSGTDTETHVTFDDEGETDGDPDTHSNTADEKSDDHASEYNNNPGDLEENGNGPTADKGGFFGNKTDFMSFMMDQAANNPKEVAAFALEDGNYYVQPWANNGAGRSSNNLDAIPGYNRSDVVEQYHTHPDPSGPSRDDAVDSSYWGIPVNVINSEGNIYQVQYPHDEFLPEAMVPKNAYYGQPIKP